MPKAVVNKLIAVAVVVVCIAVLWMSLTGSETFQWGALALTALGCANLYRVC